MAIFKHVILSALRELKTLSNYLKYAMIKYFIQIYDKIFYTKLKNRISLPIFKIFSHLMGLKVTE